MPHAIGELVHHRHVQQRLAAEERQQQLLWTDAIELALHPVADLRRGLERHTIGVLVVVPVIALEAVVAREVALQRRQHRDVQLGGVALDGGQIDVERAAVDVSARDEKAVVGEQFHRFPFIGAEGANRIALAGATIE